MRILAFTDIHGANRAMAKILASVPPADVVLLGGDLTTFGDAADAEGTIQVARGYCPRVFVVGGNMDPWPLEKTFVDLGASLDGRGMILDDVGFFGISGAPLSPLQTPHEIAEDELLATAERGWEMVADARVRVLVTHAPPFDTAVDRLRSGMHVGSKAVRAFVERYQPEVVVCGHIHESRGLASLGKSQIVNCGPAGKGYYASVHITAAVAVEALFHEVSGRLQP